MREFTPIVGTMQNSLENRAVFLYRHKLRKYVENMKCTTQIIRKKEALLLDSFDLTV